MKCRNNVNLSRLVYNCGKFRSLQIFPIDQPEWRPSMFCSQLAGVCVCLYCLAWTCMQYLGPFDDITDQPCHQSLRSAGTSHLVVLPIMLSTVANWAILIDSRMICQPMWHLLSLSTFRQRCSDWNPPLLKIIRHYFLDFNQHSWTLANLLHSAVDLAVVLLLRPV